MRLRSLVCALTLLVAACGDGDNVQYRPIGNRCDGPSDCGTRPFTCLTAGYPGGYCTKDCVDIDCPADAVCVANKCKRRCTASNGCREAEGYVCAASAAVPASPFCEVP